MDDTTVPALAEYLAQLPGYRARRGVQHPLLALLLLVCVATLCGARGQSAIADWGKHHGHPRLGRLGCTRDRAPRQPTLSRLFAQVPYRTVEGVALDGKTLRGSKRQGAAGAHLLAAFSHRAGVTLGQTGVPDKTNESGAATAFLLALALAGRVVTAEALLTQREVARTILASGGDDLLAVKENQPTLHADIAASFAPDADDTGRVGSATTVDQHGGRVACRTLTASTALVAHSDWPGLRQALKRERRTLHTATGAPTRRSCSPSGGGTGRSRTSGTTSATSPATRTAPPPAPGTPRRSRPPSATPPSASSAPSARRGSRRRAGCSPPSLSPPPSPSASHPTLNRPWGGVVEKGHDSIPRRLPGAPPTVRRRRGHAAGLAGDPP